MQVVEKACNYIKTWTACKGISKGVDAIGIIKWNNSGAFGDRFGDFNA